ncbi:MAG: nuclear transport factor 2 family protein [Flavobacteriales bacterium]|nr:nuclear transport factor 2 family protein [Flavobacteriales bacterium]
MKKEDSIIVRFYEAFRQKDAVAMAACYHPDAVFNDPAFGYLYGDQVGQMWRMLIERSKGDLVISYYNVLQDDQKGIAKWEARYTFSLTGRRVHNKINASFEFRDGLIISHDDCFSFTRFCGMAFGWKGMMMSLLPWFRTGFRKKSRKVLEKYIESKK